LLADLGETRIVTGEAKASDADLQRLREAYEAWNRGDVRLLLDQIAPDFELHDVDVPDSPVYRGREGLLALANV
jgi:ketosteroid isomerase-like protein